MRTLTHTIDVPDDNHPINLIHLTDTHLGAKACDEKLLQADIDAIKNTPNTYWIGGGDYIDCIARVGDKRYNEYTIANWLHGEADVIGAQGDRFAEMIAPISDKCLGMVQGNHEYASLKYYGRDIFHRIVRDVAQFSNRKDADLQIGYQGFVVLKFRHKDKVTWKLSLYLSHGYGGGRLPGGHALTLGRVLGDYDCDIALMGHRHIRQYVDKIIVAPKSNGHIKKTTRQGMFVPSYLDAFVQVSSKERPIDTYPEFYGLPPQHLGAVPIRIMPTERQVTMMLNREAGLQSVFEGRGMA